jgi:PPM family protein phosphatase
VIAKDSPYGENRPFAILRNIAARSREGIIVSGESCLHIEVGLKTDVGCVRGNNEDSYRVGAPLNLFVLSDGMGGQTHGEVASRIAVDTAVTYCLGGSGDEWIPPDGQFRPELSEKTNRLVSAVHLANRKIHEAALSDPRLRGMGATIVAAWLEDSQLSVVHVGDSRAYLLRSSLLARLTADHTLVAEQVRRGIVTPEQAERSTLQNVLIRALGSREEVEHDASEYPLLPGDVVLLCTDGLTRMVPDAEIADTLITNPSAQEAAGRLVALANQHGGEDNVSVIVLHILGIPRPESRAPEMIQ